MNNMRRGFTLIELIFVIVIIGILAAVAIPKMMQVQKTASAEVIHSFVGTVNRTVFPAMYAPKVAAGGAGSIVGLNLEDYMDIPEEISVASPLSSTECPSGSWGTLATVAGIPIYCRDGNRTTVPRVAFTNTGDGNTTLDASNY